MLRPLILLPLLALLVGCGGPTIDPARCTGTTRVSLTGPPGAAVTGYYVQHGQRIPLSTDLPWSLEATHVSALKIVKKNTADTVVIDLGYDSARAQVKMQETLAPKTRSATISVGDGFKSETTWSRR